MHHADQVGAEHIEIAMPMLPRNGKTLVSTAMHPR
jgi:hypothetical protein